MGGTSEAEAVTTGLAGLRRRRHWGLLNYFDGVVDIGQLDLHTADQRGEIADSLAEGAQFAAHLVEACGEANHGGERPCRSGRAGSFQCCW